MVYLVKQRLCGVSEIEVYWILLIQTQYCGSLENENVDSGHFQVLAGKIDTDCTELETFE